MATVIGIVTAIGGALGASAATAAAVGTVATVATVAGIAAQQYSAYKERQAIGDAANSAAAARIKAANIASNTRSVVDKTRPDLLDRNIDPLTGEEKGAKRKKATSKSRFKVATSAQISDTAGVQSPSPISDSRVAGVQI